MSSFEYRTVDGSGNNQSTPDLGTPDQQLIRLTDPAYADGVSAMAGGADPVQIAQDVFAQGPVDVFSAQGLNDLWVNWGQLIDHDLDLTPDASGEMVNVPGLVGPLQRSVFDPATGTDPSNPREQVNKITAFMDASFVYGSDAARAAALREGAGGRLKVSADPTGDFGLLPVNTMGLPNGGDTDPANPLFVAGDVRANENTGLTVLHTVFVREHNHWADRLAAENPGWSDEQIYQTARVLVEAEIQKITYEEYLPHLIGENALPAYQGYDPNVDPSVSNEFSTVAFRFGHSMVSSTIARRAEDGTVIPEGDVTVADGFFNNTAILESGIDPFLRGLSATTAQELDTLMVDDLNFFLQSPGGTVGFSLAALNILRGRDHGLTNYLEARAQLLGDVDPGSVDPTDFSLISSDAAVQARLQAVYGTVHAVDMWVGGLAEDKLPGSAVGALFQHMLVDQFARTRDGDRFWYESRLAGSEYLDEVQATTLSQIILRTSEVDFLQQDVFVAYDRIGGGDGNDRLTGDDGHDLIIGFAGNDVLKGRGDDDELYGGAGRDRLSGNAGDDRLFGGEGNDKLRGGWGDDLLAGGAGNDMLVGGPGDDVFAFGPGGGRDTVIGFCNGRDKIDLSAYGFDSTNDFEIRELGRMQTKLVFDKGVDEVRLIGFGVGYLTEDDFIL